MPILPVTIITTAVCDVCGGSRTVSTTNGDPSSTTVLRRAGWLIPVPGELIPEDTSGRKLLAVCQLCAAIVRMIQPEPART